MSIIPIMLQVFYWSELGYMFMVFMYAVYSGWWKNNIDWTDTPMPADMDWYKASTEPVMKEYYRMKEKLKAKKDRFQNE